MDNDAVVSIADAWRRAGGPVDQEADRNLIDALHQHVPEPEAWAVTTIDELLMVLVLADDGLYRVTIETDGDKSLARTRRLQLDPMNATVDVTTRWHHEQATSDWIRTWTFQQGDAILLRIETVERHGAAFDKGTPTALTDFVVKLAEKLGWTFPVVEEV